VRYDDSNGWTRIFDFGDGENDDNIMLGRASIDLRFALLTGTSGWTGDIRGGTITNGQFTHLVATVTSSNVMKLYQDGVLVGTNDTGVTASTVMTRTNHYLGRSNWNGNEMLKGYMKYFRVWQGHELSQGEVEDLYSERGAPTSQPTAQPTSQNKYSISICLIFAQTQNHHKIFI
jgi:hypothetical protein